MSSCHKFQNMHFFCKHTVPITYIIIYNLHANHK